MPIGAFKLNSIAKYLAPSGGGGDAPTIPTVTWTSTSVNTTTERSLNGPKSMVFLGKNNNLYNWGANGMSSSSSQRMRQVVVNDAFSSASFAQITATGQTTQQQVSSAGHTSLTDTSNTGGQHIAIIGSSTDFRWRTAVVTNWTAGSNTQPGTVSAGALSSTIARTSGITSTPSVAAAFSRQDGQPTNRFALFWQSSTNVYWATGTQASGSTTANFDITIGTTSTNTIATSVNGGNMDATGFISSTLSLRRFVVSYASSSTTYQIAAVTDDNLTKRLTTVDWVHNADVQCGSIDAVWNQLSGDKYVAVACLEAAGNTYLKAFKVTNWAAGQTPSISSGTTYTHGSQLWRCKAYATGRQGLGILVYMSSDYKNIYGRFFNVDSTTLDITVGSTEYTLTGTHNAGAYVSFGCGIGLDGSGRICLGIQGSDNVSGSSISGWHLLRSTAI